MVPYFPSWREAASSQTMVSVLVSVQLSIVCMKTKKHRANNITVKAPPPKNIYIYIFCNTPSVNHCIFKSTSEPKQLESDHMSVSEMKENARRFHRLQTHSALSKALRHQTFTTISFKNPSCENSCYANEVVTGCLVTLRSWNCCVRSLRTFRAWIRVCSLRLKWVFFYVWRSLKKKFVLRRLTLYFCCCCHWCLLVLHNIFEYDKRKKVYPFTTRL